MGLSGLGYGMSYNVDFNSLLSNKNWNQTAGKVQGTRFEDGWEYKFRVYKVQLLTLIAYIDLQANLVEW